MLPDAFLIDTLLSRINTVSLQRDCVPTVALVVFNFSSIAVSPCFVPLIRAFPVRQRKFVTVRNDRGDIIPSRIVDESVDGPAQGLQPGYFLWSLTLEFALLSGLPPHTATTFSASYELVQESTTEQEPAGLIVREDIPVYETHCHAGDLPTTFALSSLLAVK